MKKIIHTSIIAVLFTAGGANHCNAREDPVSETLKTPYEYLPLGAVKPAGWIRRQLVRDFEQGFLGCLDRLTDHAASDLFGKGKLKGYRVNAQGEKEFIPQEWWPAETEAVWMDGLVRMAFLTGHEPAIRKARAWVDHLLENQEEDGYIGIYQKETRFNHEVDNGELWTQSRALRVLLAFYEFTGEARALEAAKRAMALTMRHYGPDRGSYFGIDKPRGATGHGLMIVDVLEWLYRLTGERRYVDFAEFLYRDFSENFSFDRHGDARLPHLLDRERGLVGHTPHVAEHMRVPLLLHAVTGTDIYRQAYENGFAKTAEYTVPSGALHSGEDENLHNLPPEPHMPYEYCGVTELVNSLQSRIEKTGDVRHADQLESLVMNAGQGARFADGTAITYFSRDNRREATSEGCGGRLKFSPTHEDVAVCCTPNAAKLLPYYVNRMWMRADDGEVPTLVALCYGPSVLETELGGTNVRIEQRTAYPFDTTLEFVVTPERPVRAALRLRVPVWAGEVTLEADGAEFAAGDGLRTVTKTWQPGDTVRVNFEAPVRTVKAINGEIALQRGPLLYALPIKEERQALKAYPVEGFADWTLTPAADADGWDWRLGADEREPESGFKPVRTGDADAPHPWDQSPVALEGPLVAPDGTRTKVRLLPMGCAPLRRVTFPVQ